MDGGKIEGKNERVIQANQCTSAHLSLYFNNLFGLFYIQLHPAALAFSPILFSFLLCPFRFTFSLLLSLFSFVVVLSHFFIFRFLGFLTSFFYSFC